MLLKREAQVLPSILKGRTKEAKRVCSFAVVFTGFSTVILNKGNSYYGCYALQVPVYQERKPKPQVSIPFTYISVKLKAIALKDKPQDVEIVTAQCFWFLNS